MLKRYFSNGPRRCERKTSVLLQSGQGRLIFSFILKTSFSPRGPEGGMDRRQHGFYTTAREEFKFSLAQAAMQFLLEVRA